jgi:hypothetical protein
MGLVAMLQIPTPTPMLTLKPKVKKNINTIDILISDVYVVCRTADMSNCNRLMTNALKVWKMKQNLKPRRLDLAF